MIQQEAPEILRTESIAVSHTKQHDGGWKVRVVAYSFLIPTFAFILGFSYYPAVRALVGAFTQWDGFNPPQWIGISNFIQAFHDPTFITSIENVSLWTLIGIPLSIVPSFAVAELIFHLRSLRWQYAYRTIFIIPMVLPGVVGLLIWQYIYQPTGLLNSLLKDLGLSFLHHDWIANPHLALWALIFMGFPWIRPFNLLVLYAGLQGVSPEILDASEVDGASLWQRIWRVDVPMVFSQLKLLLILGIVGISQDLLSPLILTGGGPGAATTTPVLYMYQTAVQYDEYGYSMAIAFMLFIVVMLLAFVNIKYLRADD